ncbi:MAG: glycoside hydrolase family 36 protein [Chloroflexota bacterium]
MPILEFESIKIIARFETVSNAENGFVINGKNVSLEIPGKVKKYYTHGWQSWSLTAWTDLEPLPRSKPYLLNPMQIDPVYANHPFPNGSWVGAVELEDGKILLLGALGLDSHVQYHNGTLQGWYENNCSPNEEQLWFTAYGSEFDVFDAYADLLKLHFGSSNPKKTGNIWCSWYSFYSSIDEQSLQKVINSMADMPFDVIQVDDGWQKAIGEWQANTKFPAGMKALADNIKSTGRQAGLWLAPLLVVPSSKTYRDHPEWLVRDENGKPISAGFNWGEQLFALDTTHPQVLEWLEQLMTQVMDWGFEYVKLDFLYAGALPGIRYQNIPREAAYRMGLKVIRKTLGEKIFFLTCGAPVIPSLGLCDGMRIGPDVAGTWEDYRDAVLLYNPATPSVKNALRTSINRFWLSSLLHVDPDVVYFISDEKKLSAIQKELLRNLAEICKFKATSDLPQKLSREQWDDARKFLASNPSIERTSRYTFKINEKVIDYSEYVSLPPKPKGITRLIGEITGWLGNQPLTYKILNKLGDDSLEKMKKGL